MDAADAARDWVEVWTHGWRTHDPELIAQAYAEGAVYRSHPFREPHPGGAREYTRWAFEGEDEADVWFGEPVASGDRAAVEWWATVRSGEEEQTIAGTTVLRFDSDWRVVEQRDYWAEADGRRERPPELG